MLFNLLKQFVLCYASVMKTSQTKPKDRSDRSYPGLMNDWQQMYSDFSRRYGLNYTSLRVLYDICFTEEPVTQQDLAQSCTLSKQNVYAIIRDFLDRGWIELKPRTENRREKDILLTERGEREARPIAAFIEKCENQAITMLADEEQKQLLELTKKYLEICRAILSEDESVIRAEVSGSKE